MSYESIQEYIAKIKPRYKQASKLEKGLLIKEICTICEYNRKYAIRLLNQTDSSIATQASAKKRGPKTKYSHPTIIQLLQYLWRVTNLPCSKRLKAIIPIWLPRYPYPIPKKVEQALLSISPPTIDRLMKPWRSKFLKRGLATTKPGTILKKHIPIKTNQWDESKPGFLEADSVAHCGNSAAGMFILTVNAVDIATGWTLQRAVWGKGEQGVKNVVENMEKTLPFPLLGFDCDNGSEFLNWHLLKFFSQRKRPIQYTRSRAYHKNDNAHIEEKNWTNVRQYLGYERFDKMEMVELMNDLYTTEWYHYFNFFIPSTKLLFKERINSKTIKKYDKPKTPFQRLLESPYIDHKIKNKLQNLFRTFDPFELQKKMNTKINTIINLANQPTQYTENLLAVINTINTYSQKEERKKVPKKERRKIIESLRL
jgi:hypothetical protein